MPLDPAGKRPAARVTSAGGRAVPARPDSAPAQPCGRAAALARLEDAAQGELRRLIAALPPAGVAADPVLCELCWDLGLDGVRAGMAMAGAEPPRQR